MDGDKAELDAWEKILAFVPDIEANELDNWLQWVDIVSKGGYPLAVAAVARNIRAPVV